MRIVLRWFAAESWNDFVSHLWPNVQVYIDNYSQEGEFDFRMQIGSNMLPEYPIRSHAETYAELKDTLGMQSPFLGLDTEKV